jgi:hypothetical protein
LIGPAAEVKLPFLGDVQLSVLWEISMRHLRAFLSSALLIFSAAEVASTPALAVPTYELAMTTPATSGNLTVYRLNVASVVVANVSSSPMTNVIDPQPVPPGSYRVFVASSGDGKTYWLYRLETESGRTWFLNNGSWKEVTAK